MPVSQTIAAGLAFPECPRWHENALWFSDQHSGEVYRVAHGAAPEVVTLVPGGASGLGWLPDASMLVVSMSDRRLFRWNGTELVDYADLSSLHRWHSNDLIVDAAGNAFVGSIGFDYYGGAAPEPGPLLRVDPHGVVAIAAEDLLCPNGMVIVDDGRTLVVAESLAGRLTAFDLDPAGNLSRRRVHADLGALIPDGICTDAADRILFASIGKHEVAMVSDGRVESVASSGDREVIACVLGGPQGRTLYMCTSVSMTPDRTVVARDGRVEAVELGAAS